MITTEHTLIRTAADGTEHELAVEVEGTCYPEQRASAHDPGCAAFADVERVTLAGTEGGCILAALEPGELEELEEALLRRAIDDAEDDEARWAEMQIEEGV